MRRIKKGQRVRTVQIRQHRGSLAESLATVTTIEASVDALCKYVNWTISQSGQFLAPVTPDRIRIKNYGHDVRIGWDVELILIDGLGVWGMADGYISNPLDEAGRQHA